MNRCHFSPCRRWRYELVCQWNELLNPTEPWLLPWIGLNPSTADEVDLDPTLRRVTRFTQRAGKYDGFVMLNLFAWRATDPQDMMREMDPVGRENDATLLKWAKPGQMVVCAWGNHGGYMSRWRKVAEMLQGAGAQLVCLGTNKDGSPKHPLYLRGNTALEPWKIPREIIAEAWERRKIARALKRRQRMT